VSFHAPTILNHSLTMISPFALFDFINRPGAFQETAGGKNKVLNSPKLLKAIARILDISRRFHPPS